MIQLLNFLKYCEKRFSYNIYSTNYLISTKMMPFLSDVIIEIQKLPYWVLIIQYPNQDLNYRKHNWVCNFEKLHQITLHAFEFHFTKKKLLFNFFSKFSSKFLNVFSQIFYLIFCAKFFARAFLVFAKNAKNCALGSTTYHCF